MEPEGSKALLQKDLVGSIDPWKGNTTVSVGIATLRFHFVCLENSPEAGLKQTYPLKFSHLSSSTERPVGKRVFGRRSLCSAKFVARAHGIKQGAVLGTHSKVKSYLER